jgi:hypothetical protein
MSIELELKTQIEILKTDMGKVQASLRDAIVARENTHKILMALFEKTLDKVER